MIELAFDPSFSFASQYGEVASGGTFPRIEILVEKHHMKRQVYLGFASINQFAQAGSLIFMLNNREVSRISNLNYRVSGTAGVNIIGSSVLSSASPPSARVGKNLMTWATSSLQISPWEVNVECTKIFWQPTLQIAATGNVTAYSLACLSQHAI